MSTKPVWSVAALAGLAYLSMATLAAQSPTPESLCKSVGLTGKATESKLPGQIPLAAVAKAVGAKPKDLQAGRLFSVAGADKQKIYVASFPVSGLETASTAVIALAADMTFVATAIVDARSDAIEEWRHLMDGMKWHTVPRLKGARPRSYLLERRTWANKHPTAKDAALTLALLDTVRHMNDLASVFNLPRHADRNAAEESLMMSRGFTKVAKLAPSLAPLLKGSRKNFDSMAKEASVAAAALAEAAREVDRGAVQKHRRTVMRNCKSCHSLEVGDGLEFNSLARSERERLGIGNGFYAFGHDVRIRHADRKRAQHVLDALRVGALLIDAHTSPIETTRK